VIHQQMPALAAIGLAVLITAVIGLLLGLVIARLAGLYLAMATVAFDLIIGVIATNGGTFTGSSTGLYGILSDFTMPMMFTLTLIVLGLVVLSEHGKIGRRVHAVRDDIQLAASAGINVRRYRLVAFVVSGALGGLAGSMNVMVRSTVGPLDIGFNLIVLALTMIIVGGAMSWKGAVIGAIIFTWLPSLLEFVGKWQTLLYGIIVAVAAVLLPRGIHGVFVDLTRWIQRRRRKPAAPPPAEIAPEPDLEPLMTGPATGASGASSSPQGTPSSTSLLRGKA
jgi:branched-chain amino acid transport system permease protein